MNGKRTPFNRVTPAFVDKMITVCKECLKGIFEGQEHEWTNRGFIHTKCGVNENKDAA